MNRVSRKTLIAIGSIMMLATFSGAGACAHTREWQRHSAGEQPAQYCAPPRRGEIESQDFFC